jgi:hypothetical protein
MLMLECVYSNGIVFVLYRLDFKLSVPDLTTYRLYGVFLPVVVGEYRTNASAKASQRSRPAAQRSRPAAQRRGSDVKPIPPSLRAGMFETGTVNLAVDAVAKAKTSTVEN